MGPQTQPIVLRPYQEDAVDRIRAAFRHHFHEHRHNPNRKRLRVLFVLSTGGGKTVIFAFIVYAASDKGLRVVVIAHRREIIEQISQALDRMGIQHGLVAPGKTPTDDLVQVGMVQTLAKRIEKGLVDEPDFLIIDEAHHAVTGSYSKITEQWKKCKILGVTATPERLDGKGLGQSFDVMVQGPAMSILIEAKYLAAYDYLAPPSALDLSDVKTRGGDFAVDDLEKAMMESTIVGDAVQHYSKFLDGRPAVCFCVTRAHARSVAEQFSAAGWNAASIDGTMSAADREDLIASLADGRLHVLTSCELISEGVDVPVCAGAILLRPTKSLAMYLQQIGRALRPKPDGSAAVVIDHVGNVHRFGMPCSDRDWSLDGKAGKCKGPDVTSCEVCFKTFPKSMACKLAENCLGVDDEACPFADEEGKPGKQPPAVVDGELQVVTDIRPAVKPAWAGGMAIDKTIVGRDWHRLMEMADTKEKLQQIAEARGYKPAWVYHKLRERAETAQGVDEILTAEPYTNDGIWACVSDNVLWGIIRTVDRSESTPGPTPGHWTIARDLARIELRRRKRAVA
jgi:DNA repair protein RadD